MRLSDRDLKLLVIVLIAVVIACPIIFVLRPYNEKIKETQSHIDTLKERQSFLAKLNENRQFYNDSIVLLTNERQKIVEDFAEGLRAENTIMFLANTEQQIPIAMKSVSFSEGEPVTISEAYVNENGEAVEGLTAVTSYSSVSYSSDYFALKDFLKYILDLDKRTVVTSIVMNQDDETGLINGNLSISHYAVTGEGRELAPANIPSMEHGVERIFGIPSSEANEDEQQPAEEGQEE